MASRSARRSSDSVLTRTINLLAAIWGFCWTFFLYGQLRMQTVGFHPIEMLASPLAALFVCGGPFILAAHFLCRWLYDRLSDEAHSLGHSVCLDCGYPARGLRTTTCPECGGAFGYPLPALWKRGLVLLSIVLVSAYAGAIATETAAAIEESHFRREAAVHAPAAWSRDRWWPFRGHGLVMRSGVMSATD